jgi:uncharacterized protein YbaA (DUF1428 family)
MAKYVDGFVIPIPKENVEKYREIAHQAGEVWKEHGALEYFETVGDELEQEQMISFTQIAGAAPDETVIFAWIVYESKEDRDRINAAVMNDPRIKEMAHCDKTFDYKRMAYGGFRAIVEF